MINIFKLGWLEYKKNFCKKGLYIWLGILFLIFFNGLKGVLEKNNNIIIKPADIIQSWNFICGFFFQFILILNAINTLLEEFRYGTATFLFTGSRSRMQILFSKVLSILFLGLTLGLINYFFIICYAWRLNLKYKYFSGCGSIIFMYFIYAWITSNYFLFCSIILKNRLASFITGSFLLYLLSDGVRKIIINFGLPKKILELNPFWGILDENSVEFFKNMHINIYRALIMFCFGLIFFILSALVFNKKDLA